ncbi:MAG: ribosome biogenesis GTP-binding protein YihA/YsxC [Cyclobacteriaceae bacterium]|nr:YihA family ribosome biogenesis GTP-binding protein [Cyclobacteriaceae bacterium]MCH8515109.1 ribosome biogenesis GTP-binding protein YihA/YsxC [Cyclobacteriaceae bacterium]
MKIKDIHFVKSSATINQLPEPKKPEFAFIGRSNVGKSSLINYLAERNKLAMVSSTPGKTQLINHFEVNGEWYLVDLPGYGYAKRSKDVRAKFADMINSYLLNRENLYCVFVLIDSRIEPQASDEQMINVLGEAGIPVSMIFTKVDKVKNHQLNTTLGLWKKKIFSKWEEMPPYFLTSSAGKRGRDEILNFIHEAMQE